MNNKSISHKDQVINDFIGRTNSQSKLHDFTSKFSSPEGFVPQYKCDSNRMLGSSSAAGHFLPVFTGLINEGSPVLEVTEGQCFKKILFKLDKVIYDSETQEISELHVSVNASEPKSYLCYDWFAMVTHEFQDFQTFFNEGESILVYKNLPVGTKYDLKMNGLRVNIFCQSYLNTAASIYNLMKMFVGGLTTYTWMPVFGTHVP